MHLFVTLGRARFGVLGLIWPCRMHAYVCLPIVWRHTHLPYAMPLAVCMSSCFDYIQLTSTAGGLGAHATVHCGRQLLAPVYGSCALEIQQPEAWGRALVAGAWLLGMVSWFACVQWLLTWQRSSSSWLALAACSC